MTSILQEESKDPSENLTNENLIEKINSMIEKKDLTFVIIPPKYFVWYGGGTLNKNIVSYRLN